MGTDKQNIKYFLGTTNKNPLKYKCGEEIIFTVRSYELADGEKRPFACPMFRYTIKRDNCKTIIDELVSGKDGTLTVSSSMDTPGFCYIEVHMCDEYGEPMNDCESFSGSAGAQVEEIQQALADPDDFDEFWQNKLKELSAIPPVAMEKINIPSINDVSTAWDLKVASYGAMPASFKLAIPKDASQGKKYPIRICFSAYGVSDIKTPSGTSSIDIMANPHGIMNNQCEDYYKFTEKGLCKNFGFDATLNQSPNTCYFKNMILRDVQTLRYAMTLPEWNGKNIISTGGSMGAMRASALAALCNEFVTSLEISITWHCDIGGQLKGRMRGWRPNLTHGLRYFDTVAFAKRLKCPVKMYAGLGDTVCRAMGECALFNSIQTKKQITFNQGNEHGYSMREPEAYTFDENWNEMT